MSKPSPRVLALIAAGAIAIVALAGWYLLVSPQRSKADTLDAQISDEHAKLTVAQLLARSQKADKQKMTGAALLNQAMPQSLQMPTIVRQVQKLAEKSKVTVESFTPSGATPLAGYEAVPIAVSVTGRYSAVQRFLHQLRVQASSTRGRIHATGRLFDVQTVGLTPAGAGTPELSASIQLATYVYTGVPLPVTDTTTTAAGGSTAESADATGGS